VTLELKDGGYGDNDHTENGVIIDPSGPVIFDSSSTGTSDSGCFIATAAYGSLFEEHVVILRQFRDTYLLHNGLGRALVKAYYKYSPPIADSITDHNSFKPMVRISLLPVVGISWITLKIGPLSTVALMLFFAFGLIGLVSVRKKFNR
jgi:hypothetical protein